VNCWQLYSYLLAAVQLMYSKLLTAVQLSVGSCTVDVQWTIDMYSWCTVNGLQLYSWWKWSFVCFIVASLHLSRVTEENHGGPVRIAGALSETCSKIQTAVVLFPSYIYIYIFFFSFIHQPTFSKLFTPGLGMRFVLEPSHPQFISSSVTLYLRLHYSSAAESVSQV
jgi:hypothetical protein